MRGRDRLEIGTYGDINTVQTPAGTVRAEARYRDWDGEVRKVTTTAGTARAAKQALRKKLGQRGTATRFGTTLTPDSAVSELAAAWLEDVQMRVDLAPGTKDLYRRELRSLILPTFKKLRLREVTTGRVDHFLKTQATVSYAHARHSRVVLSLMFNFALRHDAVHHNPVAGTTRLKQPKTVVKALTLDELEQIRAAAAQWRTGKSMSGPRPDGQVRDLIEVLIGTSDRIGEALALRKCDIDDSRREEGKPMRVTVCGTLVTITGKGTYRQQYPKTDASRRTLEVPEFSAEVIRRRLARIEDEGEEHLLFFTRNGTPLTPNNARRTLRKMLTDAEVNLKVSPHAFRRTGGTVIARATDSQTAADALGNSKEIAEKHYIEVDAPAPNPTPAIHLERLAPRNSHASADEPSEAA
ncbi:tyrosine-type recombinase/integrase [Microbacterium sp. F2E]|uniref:site-specific integrase n=1 Tax=Microbacterium TaxID=33882 RepID=UPI001E48BFD3|nr:MULTISPECIES: tyrosine-type recombinase/integrase [Microbacterium]MCC9055227.1 tyrosine-type recombinase/integrase [Microbacterium sp. F2E]